MASMSGTSGTATEKNDIKKKGKRTKYVKIAEQGKKNQKFTMASMSGTSGTATEKNDIKKKGKRTKCVKIAEQGKKNQKFTMASMSGTSGTATEKNDTKKKGKRTKCVKIAEQGKNNQQFTLASISVTSGTATEKNDIKKKRKRTRYVKTAEEGGFEMFMIKDYLVRYYQTHPRANKGLVTWEIANASFLAGNEEWFNMSDSKKAEWMEDYDNMIAEGKDVFTVQNEYRHLYIH